MRIRYAAPAACLLILGSALCTTPAAGQLGISGGLNFSELHDIDAGDTRATFDRSTGWHIHLWADLPLGPVALRPGVRFTDMGKLLEDASIDDVPNPVDDEN